MDVLLYLVLIALSGLIVGALARLALPGPDPMSIPQTMLLGIAGSIIAGLAVWAIAGEPTGAGLFFSFLAAAAILYFIRRRRGGSLSEPGTPSDR